MGVLTWAITGVGAGFLSKALSPGRAGEPARLMVTVLLGIAAAVLSGMGWNLVFRQAAVAHAGIASILAAYGGATAFLIAIRTRRLYPVAADKTP